MTILDPYWFDPVLFNDSYYNVAVISATPWLVFCAAQLQDHSSWYRRDSTKYCGELSILIKSLGKTGLTFMFLYRFSRCRHCRPQNLVHTITFEQLFGFLSFLVRLLALTYRLPDFGRDLDLEFSRSNMEFAISQPEMVWLPRNEKQTYRLNSSPQMWPSGLTMAMTLNFQGQI